jgi:hypothetical protein
MALASLYSLIIRRARDSPEPSPEPSPKDPHFFFNKFRTPLSFELLFRDDISPALGLL